MTKNQSNASKITYFLVSIIFLICFNLYTASFLSLISQETSSFLPGLNLNYMENIGAAFSILQGSQLFLIIFAILAICVIFYYLIKHISELSMMAIFMASLLVCGIACNMYERISLGFVRDYFEFTFVNFPIFNISDIFINVSVIVIMYMLLTKNKR